MSELKQKWNQVVISNPVPMSGMGIHNLINLMQEVEPFKYVILEDMEGIAEEHFLPILQEQHYTRMRLKDLIPMLLDVKYLKLGTFYLFKEYPENWDDTDHTFDAYLVGPSNSTIRIVDKNNTYVYTPHESVVEIIKKNYIIEEIKTDFLEGLDYPY